MLGHRACVATVAVLLGLASAVPTFSEWKRRHGRSYESEAEEQHRREVYHANLLFYAARAAEEPLAVFGVDEWSDETPEAFFAARAGGFSGDAFDGMPSDDTPLPMVSLDNITVDWRDPKKNQAGVRAVTPVKNQGAFGTCWSFGATGCLEGMLAIQQRLPLQKLSEQELIDCCKPCRGSGPQTSWNFLINTTKGTDSTEASYPYQGKVMPCALQSGKTVNGSRIVTARALIKSYVAVNSDKVTQNQDKILNTLHQVGPGNIGVDATCLFGYRRGIISNCTGKSVDHATLLVGAGTENGTLYWTVKNSWGPGFGEAGYYRMERNKGQCKFTGAAFPLAHASRPGPAIVV